MAHESPRKQKVVIVGAGPVGSLAALYAAARGDDVEVYELRGGEPTSMTCPCCIVRDLLYEDMGFSTRKLISFSLE